MPASPEDLAYRTFCRTGDPDALAEVYDKTADRLLRAALCLAPGPAAAEDLVQATFVLAIEKAASFDPARPVLPWLCGILAKQAQLARWRRQREPDRDRLAWPEPPRPADAAQDREFAQALDQAIDKLPATYRPVLVLRLRHGMAAADIAHALGRPPGTVRSQLTRGLELVRKLLPVGFASSIALLLTPARGLAAVREVVLASLPAAATAASAASAAGAAGAVSAGGASGVAVSASTAASIVGGVIVKKILISVLAAAVVVALGVSFWPEGTAPAPIVDPVVPAVAARPAGALAADTGPGALPPEERREVESPRPVAESEHEPQLEPPPVDSGFGALSVRVVWRDDRQPAAGVNVSVAPEGARWAWVERQLVTTDPHGMARVPRVPAGRVQLGTDRGGEGVPAEIAAGVVNELTLSIPAGIAVGGVVVDSAGQPIREASVWLSERWRTSRGLVVARTGADGRFQLRDVSRDRNLAVRARGYQPSREYPIKGEVGADNEYRIVLAGGGGVAAGRVVDGRGEAVALAHVLIGEERPKYDRRHEDGSVAPGPPPVELVTGADGGFWADGLETGTVPLRVRAAGFAPFAGTMEVAEEGAGNERCEVVLTGGAVVLGLVTDATGRPAAFTRIHTGRDDGFLDAAATADATGAFRFADLPAGEVDLHAYHFQLGESAARVELSAGVETRWDPVLGDGGGGNLLRGRLVDHEGEPLAGWRVVAGVRGDQSSAVAIGTGEDGRFERRVPWRELRVWAHPPRAWHLFPPVLRDDVVADGTEFELRLPDPAVSSATIRGRVVDTAGRPQKVEVQIWHQDLRLWRAMPNEPETGEIRIENVPPGECSIEVRSESYPWIKLGTRQLAAGGTLDLGTIELAAAGHVAGQVRFGDGTAPRELKVTVHDEKGLEVATGQYADGQYRSGPLAAGRFELMLVGRGVVRQKRAFRLEAGEDSFLDVTVVRGAPRVLRFQLPDGGRPRYLSVVVRGSGGEVVWVGGISSTSGSPELELSFEPGSYSVKVSDDRQNLRAEATIDVPDLGARAEPIVIRLGPEPGGAGR